MTWERLVAPHSADEQMAQQERLVNILALGGVFTSIIYGIVLLVGVFLGQDISVESFVGVGICLSLSSAALYLSRRGQVQPAAAIVVFAACTVGFYAVFMRGGVTMAAVTMAPSVVFAGIMFGGRTSLVIAATNIIVYAGITLAQDQGWIHADIANKPFTAIGLTAVSMLLLALVTWQAVQNLQLYIQRLQERERVQQNMAAEKDRLLEELQQREEARYHLLETVRELGSPVIPLAEGVIAVPLIGAIDSERAAGLTQALLRGVAEHRARAVLVDITSVPLVDAEVAGALIRAMTGVRLLGAEPVLTGIRAEVAQTIVGLGLDLSGMMTLGSLQEGLSYVMEQAGPEQV